MIKPKRDAMKNLKNEEGYTLLELVIVIALIGGIMIFLMSTFLSIHKTYIRADKKAQNLEEARLIINHITDNFQSCDAYKVMIYKDIKGDQTSPNFNQKQVIDLAEAVALDDLDENGFGVVKEVAFEEKSGDPNIPNTVVKIGYSVKK